MSKVRQTLFQQLQDESAKAPVVRIDWRSSNAIRVTILVITPILCALFFPSISHLLFKSGESLLAIKGQTWQNETIIAQSSFPIRKTDNIYAAEVREAMQQSPMVFRSRNSRQHVSDVVQTEILKRITGGPAGSLIRARLTSIVTNLESRDFLNLPLATVQTRQILAMPTAVSTMQISLNNLIDSATVQSMLDKQLRDILSQEQIQRLEEELFRIFQPSLEFWPEKTEQLKNAAAESVPHTIGIVRKGEIVVAHGETVTEAVMTKLQSYGFVRDDEPSEVFSMALLGGSLLHSYLIFSLLVLFLYFLRKKIIGDNLKLISLSLLTVLSAALSWISLQLPHSFATEYLVLIPAFAMIAAIYFDSRTGFIVTVTSSLMFSAVRANDSNGAFALLFAGTLGAYSVRDLRTRTQLFRSIAFITAGFILVIVSTALERGSPLGSQLNAVFCAVINAVISPLITFAVIAVSERFFGVMTDLTLREYDNVNHPLLIEMSEKAPGTYQHTLAIANLVERAAYAIEASPLLARVGAYFHDIGKIPKAEYFIENQIELQNKHDLLSPKKSATIIRNHVADGVELAREYSLPDRIVDFIPMHHGTGLIKHFYAKALDESEADGTTELVEEQYRYPGPKPQSKETALVMLADGVEAISRTVDDRDALEQSIDKIFKEKIMDGQLDECDITLRDLNIVKEVFARNLVGAHHQRIQYKEITVDPDSQS